MKTLAYGFGFLETLDIPLVITSHYSRVRIHGLNSTLNSNSVSDTIWRWTLSSEGEIQILTAQQS